MIELKPMETGIYLEHGDIPYKCNCGREFAVKENQNIICPYCGNGDSVKDGRK